jgi:hypothetical protein
MYIATGWPRSTESDGRSRLRDRRAGVLFIVWVEKNGRLTRTHSSELFLHAITLSTPLRG